MNDLKWRKSSYSSTNSACVELARLPRSSRKSSYSGTNSDCVELARLPRSWHKSSYSGTNSDCVELAGDEHVVLMRNSNHPDAGTLALTRAEIEALVTGIKAGELDQ